MQVETSWWTRLSKVLAYECSPPIQTHLDDRNSIWIWCLKAKYLKGKSIFETSFCKGDSFAWKSILARKKPIFKRARFKLGNGGEIHPLYDPWIPHLEDGLPKLREGTNPKSIRKVFELKKTEVEDWDVQKVRGIFYTTSKNAILQLKWPTTRCEDKLL